MGEPPAPAAVPAATAAAKAAMRASLRASRARRIEVDRAQVAETLAQLAVQRYGNAAVVAAYASYGTEPRTGALRAGLRASGVRVLLPVVRGDTLAWVADDGAPLRRGGERGMPEPDSPVVGIGPGGLLDSGCTVLLIPALAVARDGLRLGQGGGYYDRLLSALPAHPEGPLRVAVVHDDEVLPSGSVPAEPHDLEARVDEVLTPSGVHVLARRA